MFKFKGFIAYISYNEKDVFIKEYPRDNIENIENIIKQDLEDIYNSKDFYEGEYREVYQIINSDYYKYGSKELYNNEENYIIFGDIYTFKLKTSEEKLTKLENRLDDLLDKVPNIFDEDGNVNLDVKKYLNTVINNYVKLDNFTSTNEYFIKSIEEKLPILTLDNIRNKLTSNELDSLNEILNSLKHRQIFHDNKEEERLKNFITSYNSLNFAEKENGLLEQIKLLGYNPDDFRLKTLNDNYEFIIEKSKLM